MRKVIFLGCPAYGHTYPTLAVVKELTERGVKVIYYNTAEFREILENAGAEFRLYRSKASLDVVSKGIQANDLAGIFKNILPPSVELLESHLEELRAEQADCLIYDSMTLWGLKFAQELKIPTVCSISSFAMAERLLQEVVKVASFQEKINFIRLFIYFTFSSRAEKEMVSQLSSGLCSNLMKLINMLTDSAETKLVYTSKRMQPRAGDFDDTFNFVGPSISDRKESLDLPLDDRPLIYISLGTVFSSRTFIQTVFKAFDNGRYRAALSIGTSLSVEELGPIPTNFIVKNYFPQLEVLKRADLFISHCGMNSAHESLYHGVPIICVPQMGEQAMVANAVASQGAGIYLSKPDAPKLRAAAEKILSDKRYKENCLSLKEGFVHAGGAARAAEVIMERAGLKGELISEK